MSTFYFVLEQATSGPLHLLFPLPDEPVSVPSLGWLRPASRLLPTMSSAQTDLDLSVHLC